jgi:hypothetical protein
MYWSQLLISAEGQIIQNFWYHRLHNLLLLLSLLLFGVCRSPAPLAHHILRPTHVFERIPLQICKPRGYMFRAGGPNLRHIWLDTLSQLTAMHLRYGFRVNGGAFCLIFRGECEDVGDPTRVLHWWWCHQSFCLTDCLQVGKVASFRDTTRRVWVVSRSNELLCKWWSASRVRHHIVTVFCIADGVKEILGNETAKKQGRQR